jgi:hypothetical protein
VAATVLAVNMPEPGRPQGVNMQNTQYVEFHAPTLDRLAKAMCAVVVDPCNGFDAGFDADRELLCAWDAFVQAPAESPAVHTVPKAFATRFHRQVRAAVNERIVNGVLDSVTARRLMRLFAELPHHVETEDLVLEPVYTRFRISLATHA